MVPSSTPLWLALVPGAFSACACGGGPHLWTCAAAPSCSGRNQPTPTKPNQPTPTKPNQPTPTSQPQPNPPNNKQTINHPPKGEAIAYNLREMFGLRVPLISVVIGEGGSGGALAIGCANRNLIMQNSVYYVASPEACAAILWKSRNATGTVRAGWGGVCGEGTARG